MQIISYYSQIKKEREAIQYKKDLPYIILSVSLFWFVILLAIFTN